MLIPRSLALACALVGPALAQPEPAGVFDEAWVLVRENFYDPDLHGVDWRAVHDELLPLAERADSAGALSAVIHNALGRLGASHTHHYHPGEASFYELLDIFNPDGLDPGEHSLLPAGPVTYVGIGIATREIGGRVFVAEVYATGPADRAGLLVGDEIVGVAGEPWRGVLSFAGREGEPTEIAIRREGPDAPERVVSVRPARIQPRESFLADTNASARIVEHDARRVASIRVLSYAHPDYHDAVMQHIQTDFADADALVLDIRGGWGGANTEYLAMRNPLVPEFEMRPRGKDWVSFLPAWRKPMVLLVDGGTRSGKELLAYALKEHHAATLVGARTAGAVLGGRPYILADGSVLYLAVADARVDGVRLEGVGVEPDVAVESTLEYSGGVDAQWEAAVARAAAESEGE